MLWSDKPSGEMFPKEEIQWKKLLHWKDFLKSFFTPFIKAKIIYDWMSCIILCIWLWDFVFAWEDAWMTRKNGLNGQNTFIYYVCSIFCSYMKRSEEELIYVIF